jgi:predicted GNAT family acetyltransferase
MNPIEISHLEDSRKFQTEIDGKKGVVEYLQVGQRIIFTHTEVDPALEGQGIASLLAKHVLEYAREKNYEVMPLCPYIAGYISRHPEYKSLVLKGINIA